MFECVLNVAEGRDPVVLAALDRAAGHTLADRHSDPDHHRSVLTLLGDGPEILMRSWAVIIEALARIDMAHHRGVHPRLGAVDVVPFVALAPSPWADAVSLRDVTAHRLAADEGVPVFLYGPLANGTERSLPEIRRHAFRDLAPDFGPPQPDPHHGATCVGARPVLVAWNLWLSGTGPQVARAIAATLRGPAVRALAFEIGDAVQVSCNVIDTTAVRLGDLYDRVRDALPATGRIERAELVGLLPEALLQREPRARWAALGLSAEATIESRLP